MSENNNIEFTFDYNEAETVDRLISLENALDMLEQLYRCQIPSKMVLNGYSVKK